MLVHHADAQGRGVVGVVDLHNLAVLPDLARLRLVQTEQYAHQGGLARAVLSQKGVDLPPPELKCDVIVGDDTGELFGNVEHLNDVFRFHSPHPASSVKIILLYNTTGRITRNLSQSARRQKQGERVSAPPVQGTYGLAQMMFRLTLLQLVAVSGLSRTV